LEQAGSIFIHDYLSTFVLHFTAPLISLAAGVGTVLRFWEGVPPEIRIRDKFGQWNIKPKQSVRLWWNRPSRQRH
jgi:hypothetical protein